MQPVDYRTLTKPEKPPKGQGGVVGDEYVTYEIEKDKAPRLAEWLNQMDADGYELSAMEGYGGGGSVYLMAVVRRKRQ